MAFIKTISGFRGTIGGKPGDNLTPVDAVECAAAYGAWLLENGHNPRVVIGRDARISGKTISSIVANTLVAMGIEVIGLSLTTTPTVEMAVKDYQAGGGIIISASHNPKEWNALKFVNNKGEFISHKDGRRILELAEKGGIEFVSVDEMGSFRKEKGALKRHIKAILDLPLVDVEAIKAAKFSVVVDPVNSSGAIAIPALLKELGCTFKVINQKADGEFAHNPEPLPENMLELSQTVVNEKADLGIAVDPDVDRLAFVCEDGVAFGEEYTLVAVADYVLQHKKGDTVSNLSSTRALRDVTRKHGGEYFASAVGEVNVVTKMKEKNAVIGGEGNGGIIDPELHYGRDALVGVALFLTHLAKTGLSVSELRKTYPDYFIVKDKIQLTPEIDTEAILKKLYQKFQQEDCTTIDGLKIDFAKAWVHMRRSNTEAIIRIYTEAVDELTAKELAVRFKGEIEQLTK